VEWGFPVFVVGQLSPGVGHLAFLVSPDLLLLLLESRTRSRGGLRRHGRIEEW
jgi:hypothetical protein